MIKAGDLVAVVRKHPTHRCGTEKWKESSLGLPFIVRAVKHVDFPCQHCGFERDENFALFGISEGRERWIAFSMLQKISPADSKVREEAVSA